LENIKHGFQTLAACGGSRGVDDTSTFFFAVYTEIIQMLVLEKNIFAVDTLNNY
jgi:hypothetical protein